MKLRLMLVGIVLAILIAYATTLACEMPEDPDDYDPDNPVCEECCGYGCEKCEWTGSPILAEDIRADKKEGEQE